MVSYHDNNMNSLVAVNQPDYLTLFSKKRRTRWDDNSKPCKYFKINNRRQIFIKKKQMGTRI